MYLDESYLIWKCANESGARPLLGHVLIKRTNVDSGMAVASDGFILAVVPVTLDESDRVGLVSAKYLRESLKAAKGTPISLNDTNVGNSKGLFPRYEWDIDGNSEYPEYQNIIPKPPMGSTVNVLGINLKLLTRVTQAIGSPKPIILTLCGGNVSLLLVEHHLRENGVPVPPFGLVMPMHIDPGWQP